MKMLHLRMHNLRFMFRILSFRKILCASHKHIFNLFSVTPYKQSIWFIFDRIWINMNNNISDDIRKDQSFIQFVVLSSIYFDFFLSGFSNHRILCYAEWSYYFFLSIVLTLWKSSLRERPYNWSYYYSAFA